MSHSVVMLVAALVAVMTGRGKLDDRPAVSVSITQYQSIFVAEIQDAHASDWDSRVPQQRTVAVKLKVSRILKDAGHQNLAPGEFDASLLQARWPGGRIGDNPYFWSDKDVRRGQQYLIFSNVKNKSLGVMFESADMAEPVSGSEDTIEDVNLVLSTSALPLYRRSQLVADALQNPAKPRSRFLAEYAAAILAAGTDSDTTPLASSLETVNIGSFSQPARSYLLWQLFQQGRTADYPPNNLLQVFVTLVARYFVAGPEQPPPELDPLQVEILQNYVPWIRSSERAAAILRKESSLPMMQEVRHKTAQIAADTRIAVERRTQVREFLNLIDGG